MPYAEEAVLMSDLGWSHLIRHPSKAPFKERLILVTVPFLVPLLRAGHIQSMIVCSQL